MSWNFESFKSKLEKEHAFPGTYLFKFIVPADKEGELMEILPEGEVSIRNSSNGTYVSVTSKVQVDSSEEVLRVYVEANKVEGILAL